MWVGIGVGIGRNRFATGIFNAYALRVTADGGITEAGQCVDAVSGILLNASLLLIPSGYKGGKLYSEIPTNGNGDLTWTRGSDAFRTNASGVIQRVPWNLLLNTNTFSGWSLEGGALTSGFTAPDGTSTAYKYVQTTGGLYSGSSTATSGSKTASIWLKSVSGTSITCNLQDGGSGNNTVVTVTGDWQLFTATYTTSTSRPSLYVWGISNALGIYVWHPQLVEGTTAQTYLPTTDRLNFPRLSYMYGSCPSALLEPQRTNSIRNSTMVGASTSPSTLPTNYGVSGITATVVGIGTENGLSYVDIRFSGTASGTNTQVQLETTTAITASNGQTWTQSVYLKLINTSTPPTDYNMRLREGTAAGVFVADGITAISPTTSLQRFTYTRTNTGALTERIQPILLFSQVAGNTYDYTIRIAQPQMELGAYVTTPIFTTSATATRVADSFSRNNIYTNGLISASGGTWFVSLVNNVAYTRDASLVGLFLGDTSVGQTNSFAISCPTGNDRLRIGKFFGGYNQLFQTTTSTVKIAIKWNGTSADVFVNGTKQVSATAFTATALEFLAHSTSGDVPKFIQQMALYPEPLTDTKLIELTTL